MTMEIMHRWGTLNCIIMDLHALVALPTYNKTIKGKQMPRFLSRICLVTLLTRKAQNIINKINVNEIVVDLIILPSYINN